MQEEEFGLITDQEVYEAVCIGEVIETYPDDTPYPSVLLFRYDGYEAAIAHGMCLR
jgi:hypothetical protein